MDQKLLHFALQDVPRYTSYPAAVQFQDDFPGEKADRWLAEGPLFLPAAKHALIRLACPRPAF